VKVMVTRRGFLEGALPAVLGLSLSRRSSAIAAAERLDVQRLAELPHRHLPLPKELHDGDPCGVGKCLKDARFEPSHGVQHFGAP